ncbi:hypothetical protein quinque_003986 [Culex quinquefasciatus]
MGTEEVIPVAQLELIYCTTKRAPLAELLPTEYIRVVPPETLRLNKCLDMGEFLFSVNKVMWENSQDMCECNQNYGILQLVVKVR